MSASKRVLYILCSYTFAEGWAGECARDERLNKCRARTTTTTLLLYTLYTPSSAGTTKSISDIVNKRGPREGMRLLRNDDEDDDKRRNTYRANRAHATTVLLPLYYAFPFVVVSAAPPYTHRESRAGSPTTMLIVFSRCTSEYRCILYVYTYQVREIAARHRRHCKGRRDYIIIIITIIVGALAAARRPAESFDRRIKAIRAQKPIVPTLISLECPLYTRVLY